MGTLASVWMKPTGCHVGGLVHEERIEDELLRGGLIAAEVSGRCHYCLFWIVLEQAVGIPLTTRQQVLSLTVQTIRRPSTVFVVYFGSSLA